MQFVIISQTMLAAIIFLVPLFFTSLTSEFYATGKEAFLFFTIPILMLITSILFTKENKFEININKLTIPVLGIAAAFIVSTLINSANKIESLTSSTGTGVIVSFVLIFLSIGLLVKKKETVIYPLITASFVLAVLYILQFFKITSIIFPFSMIKDNPFWTPAGTLLGLAIILAASLPITIEMALLKESLINPVKSILGWVGTIVITLSLVLALVSVIKDAKPAILPFDISWSIAVDTLKNVRNAFFGVGPGNFVDAFTISKPIEVNNTSFWNIRFGVAGSYILNLLTETGAVGLFFYLFTFIVVISFAKKNLKNGIFISLVILFVLSIILPATIITLFYLFILLGLFSLSIDGAHITENSTLFPRVTVVFWAIVLIVTWWFAGRWFLGEYYFQKSLVAASQNQGLDTYNDQIKAVDYNPYNERYRITYSQTNIALASGLSQNENPSDQDRQNISTLIQQAIREAKIATSLNPRRAGNWENLAVIYQAILNATEGADQWTIASLNQAVRLDPLNPTLRIGLGGVLFQLKNYDGAIQQFSIATQLKPDLANGYYNLSAALKAKGDLQGAFNAMQNTISLVDPYSNDFNKASAELEELRRQLPDTSSTQSDSSETETLTNPAESPVEIKPTIELKPEEAAPDVPESSPSPAESEPTPNI
ncbi:tetratricopeptide repeat protein [Candidatus Gottesmanbacteria bacterium]|nr:tetratricopeptide repeat protein [Candidatus Gottesmanbacteria bacterium]